MFIAPKIALSFPEVRKADNYFTFRLKQSVKNEDCEYKNASSLFVVADIEGNFYEFCKLLINNGVIDKSFKWKFEDGHLVVVGDCFDRGEQVTECLWLLYSLEEKARKNGGHVHFILGNHEIMNLNGNWRYVHPKYAKKTGASNKFSTALYDGNKELWRWLCTKNIIEKIGDILFVHGGISNEVLQLNLSIGEINAFARQYYAKGTAVLENSALNTLFNSNKSPFWYRGYYRNEATQELIDDTLQYYSVNTIITGHTVLDRITPFFNGKVINVDTDHASGNSEALLIKKNRFYRIDKNGKHERLK